MAADAIPSVSRALRFVTVDPLQSEAVLRGAEDHSQGVLRWPAAETRRGEALRASALRSSIEDMEEVNNAMTEADQRQRRRLTQAALKTRRVHVPRWASPGGDYWPVVSDNADDRRIAQLHSLDFCLTPLPAIGAAVRSPSCEGPSYPSARWRRYAHTDVEPADHSAAIAAAWSFSPSPRRLHPEPPGARGPVLLSPRCPLFRPCPPLGAYPSPATRLASLDGSRPAAGGLWEQKSVPHVKGRRGNFWSGLPTQLTSAGLLLDQQRVNSPPPPPPAASARADKWANRDNAPLHTGTFKHAPYGHGPAAGKPVGVRRRRQPPFQGGAQGRAGEHADPELHGFRPP